VTVNTRRLIGGLRRAELVAGDRASDVKLELPTTPDDHGQVPTSPERLRRARSRTKPADDLTNRLQRTYLVEILNHVDFPADRARISRTALAGRHPAARRKRSRHATLRVDAAAPIGVLAAHRAAFWPTVRNYAALDFAPAPGLNVFAGRTRKVRATCSKRSPCSRPASRFRARREVELIRDGAARRKSPARPRIRPARSALHASSHRQRARKAFDVTMPPVGRGVLGPRAVVTFIPATCNSSRAVPRLRRNVSLNGALAASAPPAYYRDLARYR